MSEPQFRISLEKEGLTFSAAHFITFGNNICERLHGHNYAVRCEISGKLNNQGYVVDFIALRDQLASITSNMDHRVLLPTKHPSIAVRTRGNEVEAVFEDRRWVFPADDCLLLPIANTTVELLASHIVSELKTRSDIWSLSSISRIVVGVDENQGQWGECAIDFPE